SSSSSAWRIASRNSSSGTGDLREQQRRVLEQLAQTLEETGRLGAVDDPVVARERNLQERSRDELVAVHDRAPRDLPDREDRGLRRVDDRVEAAYSEHAEVRDGEGSVREVVRGQRAVTRGGREPTGLGGDLEHGLAVGVADGRDDERVVG